MRKVKGLTLVLGGEAGQGIQFIEKTLLKIVKSSGFYVFVTKEYMSRIRGGINTTEIRISSEPVRAHVEQIDCLIPLKVGWLIILAKESHEKQQVDGDSISSQEGKVCLYRPSPSLRRIMMILRSCPMP